MIINRKKENINLRLNNEFEYLKIKYKNIAFNIQDWNGRPNNRPNGKNILIATEGYITIPNNYNPEIIKQYDAFITYNSKFKELHPDLNIHLQNAPINCGDFYELETHLNYKNKIKGVCSIQRVYNTGSAGDINYMKDSVMKGLNVEPHLCLHTFGPKPFGKPDSYQCNLEAPPNHYKNLKKINDYLFCWCPEPIYHELWSYNYVTERLFNCFKSKTIAIYYGCYNIENLVPTELFIDFRNFQSLNELSQYLIELSNDEKKYTEIVEAAYNWNLKNKLGSITLLEEIFQECIQKYRI
jgi:hypothetical protein